MRHVRWTSSAALSAALFFGALTPGCGHSEEEMQAKQREIASLKSQLDAEKEQHKKALAEIAEREKSIEELKDQVRKAGLNISNLSANLEEQARALEDYKRRAEQLEQIKKRFEALRSKLQSLTKLGLTVSVRNNRMVIALPGDVLFDSGKETLKSEGKSILLQVADVIRGDSSLAARTFQVAGHTDAQPLVGGRFKDNWGLSVMRAREVLVFLIDPQDKGGGGLSPTRWSASGYGDTDPVVANDTPENKQKNRRVELVVVPNVEEMLDLKQLTQ